MVSVSAFRRLEAALTLPFPRPINIFDTPEEQTQPHTVQF